MNRTRAGALVLLLAAGGGVAYYLGHARSAALVLTGIVTTNDVIVSPQIAGQITQLLVKEGDTVKRDQLLAVIAPDELRAEISYYSHNAAGMTRRSPRRAQRSGIRNSRPRTRSGRPKRIWPPPRRRRPRPRRTSRRLGWTSSATRA